MRTINSRIAALEQQRHPGLVSRILSTCGGDDDPLAFLRAQGIDLTDTDLVVHRRIMRPSPAGPIGADCPMRMR